MNVEPRCDHPTDEGPCIRTVHHWGEHRTITRTHEPWIDTTEETEHPPKPCA